jgi:signal peptidase II
MLVITLGLLIGLLDQITKQSVRDRFALGEMLPVLPGFFNLTYLRNTGAAWGMLGGQNSLLIVFSFVMLFVIIVFRRSFLSDTLSHRIALGCMIGGIVGNLLDRIRLGYVTDFLYFHVREWAFPAFNVADSAICIGVGLYMFSSFHAEYRGRREAVPAAEKEEGGSRP